VLNALASAASVWRAVAFGHGHGVFGADGSVIDDAFSGEAALPRPPALSADAAAAAGDFRTVLSNRSTCASVPLSNNRTA
jgi:hypothetical protein